MFSITTLVLSIIVLISWGFSEYFIQKTTRKIGSIGTIFWIGTIGGLVMLPFCYNNFQQIFYCDHLVKLIILSILFFIFGFLVFEALERGKLSVVEIVITLELPITVLLSVVYFKEIITWWQMILMLLVFVSVILISKKPIDWKDYLRKLFGLKINLLESGVIIALFAALTSALTNFGTAITSRHVDPLTTIAFVWITNGLSALFIIYCKGWTKNFLKESHKITKNILLTAFFDTLAWTAFAMAVQKGALSLTIAIAESYPAISIFLARRYGKEKISKIQIFGAIMALTISFILAVTSTSSM